MKPTCTPETLQALDLVLTAVEASDPLNGCITRMRLADGATWTEIAAAVGLSRSAASDRFTTVVRALRVALAPADAQ